MSAIGAFGVALAVIGSGATFPGPTNSSFLGAHPAVLEEGWPQRSGSLVEEVQDG
ncbi:MAG TPA: hypothetical protein VFB81_13905 [Myxococcales bacterium]|nr:hypothetical protein [Myxococcales bacterium]